jgi:hypothetical protein
VTRALVGAGTEDSREGCNEKDGGKGLHSGKSRRLAGSK